MFNKKILVASLLALGLTSTAQAADPSATVMFEGFAGNSVPGADLIITGKDSGDIADGDLNVKTDGTFTTQFPVILEAHSYDTTDIDNPVIAPELADTAEWTVTGVRSMFGNNVDPAEANITVTDTGPKAVTLDVDTASAQTGELLLNVTNDAEVTGLSTGDAVNVSVAITAALGA